MYALIQPGRCGFLRNLLQAVLVLVAAPALFAYADSVPDQVPEHRLVRVVLNPDQKCFVLSAGLEPVDTVKTEEGVAFTGAPGRYAVLMFGDSDTTQEFVEITPAGPQPPKPTPPGPQPQPPKPDPPGPTPTPAPIAMEGLRVLFVYESASLSSLPAPQRAIMQSTKVMDWMNRNCHKVDDRPEWRMVDQHTPVAFATPFFTAAVARPRSALPWLLINNGTKGTSYEGPLPATVDEMLALLEAHK